MFKLAVFLACLSVIEGRIIVRVTREADVNATALDLKNATASAARDLPELSELQSDLVAPAAGPKPLQAKYTIRVKPKLKDGVPQIQEIRIMPPKSNSTKGFVKPLMVLKQNVTKPMIENIEIDVPEKGLKLSSKPSVEVIEGDHKEMLEVSKGQAVVENPAQKSDTSSKDQDEKPKEENTSQDATEPSTSQNSSQPSISQNGTEPPTSPDATAPSTTQNASKQSTSQDALAAAPVSPAPVSPTIAPAPAVSAAPVASAVAVAPVVSATQAAADAPVTSAASVAPAASVAVAAPAASVAAAAPVAAAAAAVPATSVAAAAPVAAAAAAVPATAAATLAPAAPVAAAAPAAAPAPAASVSAAEPAVAAYTRGYTSVPQTCSDDGRCMIYPEDRCREEWLQTNCRLKCRLCSK